MDAGNRGTDGGLDHTLEINDDLYQLVIMDFKETGSVKKTAENCRLARVTAQKILITEGLWSSRTSRKVAELLQQGMTVKEIALALGITEKTVQTYTPYTRGMYGVSTQDARYSLDYRERMRTAAANMHQKGLEIVNNEEGMIQAVGSYPAPDNRAEEEAEMTEINEGSVSAEPVQEMVAEQRARRKKEFEAEEFRKPYTDDESWAALRFSAEELERYEADPDSKWNLVGWREMTSPSKAGSYHLRLELIPDCRYGEDLTEYLGGEEHKKRFLQLAKAERGITRDVVVPGDMNLHALHYAIQQAFGWQNSHLHRFCLSEDGFNRLTAGRVGGYMDLCGILFRCDNEDTNDLYWDDDYQPEMSVRTWLKRKYSRPFRHYAISDTRYQGKRHKAWIQKKYPEITEDMRVSILNREHFGEMFCDDLREGLLVQEIFSTDGCGGWNSGEIREWKEYLTTESIYQDEEFLFEIADAFGADGAWGDSDHEADFDGAMIREIVKDVDSMMDDLRGARTSRGIAEREIWRDKQLGTDEGHQYIEEQTGCSAEEALSTYEAEVKYLEYCCDPFFTRYVVRPLPFTNELLYQYDYGDNWWVKITLIEIGDADIRQAKCVAADGLNLVDDCGGISGYYDFLQTVYGTDPEEKEGMRQWARGLGWTGRKRKPENIL